MEGVVKSLYAQRSPEWFQERLGKFTSSEIFKLLKGGRRDMTEEELALRIKGEKRSTIDVMFGDGAMTYIYEKLNELTTGEVEDNARGEALDWGIYNEPFAVKAYMQRFKVHVFDVGFVTYNDFFGGSPDGEVGVEDILDNGLIEVKCPFKGANHLKMFRIKTIQQFKEAYPEHYAQMQGNLLASNRGWCDFVSFDPRQNKNAFRLFVLRIPRDEAFIENMKVRIDAASDILVEHFEEFIQIAKDYVELEEAA